jgi:hypothetical protein
MLQQETGLRCEIEHSHYKIFFSVADMAYLDVKKNKYTPMLQHIQYNTV